MVWYFSDFNILLFISTGSSVFSYPRSEGKIYLKVAILFVDYQQDWQ